MIANCSDSTESNNTNICRLAHYIFIKYLILSHACRNMEKKTMEIDESLLDDEDGDDITICGRESISSLFIRACGIGPEDVFEDQRCTSQHPLKHGAHAFRTIRLPACVLSSARGP